MLIRLFDRHALKELLQTDATSFVETYQKINKQMWQWYGAGKINKEMMRQMRFHDLLKAFGYDNHPFSLQLNDEYITECPQGKHVIEGTFELLASLKGKYSIHVISNGFAETTKTKLRSSGIDQYIGESITSEEAKSSKPHQEIFLKLLRKIGATPEQCIMIGDNYATDITGAQRMNMDHIFFNPHHWKHNHTVQYEVNYLREINDIL